MTKAIFGLVACLLLSCTHAQFIGESYLFSGNHQVVNFTQQFSMEIWYNNEQGVKYYYFVLLYEYPLPTYQQHMWMAVGLGTKTMDSADIVIWRFWKNEGKCTDRHNGRFPVTPVLDESQDVTRFRSDGTYNQYVTMGFKRKINTGDAADDFVLEPGNYTDLIWAYGEVDSTTGDIKKHSYYGVTSTILPDGASSLTAAAYLAAICGLSLMFLLV